MYLQISNGPMDPTIEGCLHNEQLEEMNFLLSKRAKDVERVGTYILY